ncbi:MAG: hypothetical protein GX943_03210 [Candidatus Pacebacteria bacterium]|jgi:broad specificity phosphatase PhoE|nr:hypothetical protein [Candidatus Paceibacterota bacterium]
MTKLSINLIRHGEKKLFLPDPGLTDLGKKQAENLAEELSKKQRSKRTKRLILTSPKKRTQETAEIIAERLRLEVQIDSFLNIDNVLVNNSASRNKILEHFKNYLKEIKDNKEVGDDSVEVLEIFAVTHSQEVRNFWQILGGPKKAIKDIHECGMWTIVIEGEKLDFPQYTNKNQ